MALFCSRRAYNTRTSKFTNNAAQLTRYVLINNNAGGTSTGGIISRNDFCTRVKGEAQSRDILFFVHGFNTSQSEMLTRMAKLETGLRKHGYRGAVVGFDWPSDGSVHSYDADKRDAKKVAPYLVTEAIALFLNENPRYKLHVLAHSMGGLLTLRGFSGVGDAPGARKWDVDQVMFVAADAESEWMRKGAWGSLVMNRRAERFTNYYSRDDAVLKLSGSIINAGRPRLGRVGLPDLLANGHEDVNTTAQYQTKVSPKGTRVSHTWYFDNDGFYRDVALTLAGREADNMPTRVRPDAGDPHLQA